MAQVNTTIDCSCFEATRYRIENDRRNEAQPVVTRAKRLMG